jgi:large subunit GTPase 1
MGKNSSTGTNLGKSIIRDRFRLRGSRDEIQSMLHTSELDDSASYTKFQSITEQSDLDNFLSTAELAGTDFTAERRNIQIVRAPLTDSHSTNPLAGFALSKEQAREMQQKIDAMAHRMTIPRRPLWNETTTSEELSHRERESFLEWRRSLAE